jgi:hypothetical protein
MEPFLGLGSRIRPQAGLEATNPLTRSYCSGRARSRVAAAKSISQIHSRWLGGTWW